MREKIKQLINDSFVYGIGDAFPKVVALLLIPVYTRHLTTYQYGTIEMMTTVLALVGILCNFGLVAAQSYFFFSVKDGGPEQKKVVTSIFQLQLIIGTIVMFLAIALSSKLNIFFFDGQLNKNIFVLAFIGSFCLMFQGQLIEILRYTHQTIKYVTIKSGRELLSVTLGVLLIVFFNQGVFGYYVGYCVAAVIAFIFASKSIKEYFDWSQLYTDWWPRILKFGLPLVPMALGIVMIDITDRWCIKHFMGLEYVGVYSLGYRFAFVLFFYSTVFRAAWWPIAMKNIDNKRLFNFVSRMFLGLGMFIVILVSLSAPLVKLIITSSYHESYKVIGILSLYFTLYGLLPIMQFGIILSEKTGVLSVIVLACAVVNILLNFIFIPIWGIVGAGVATMITMVLRNVIAILVSNKRQSFDLPLHIFIFQFLLGCLAVISLLIMNYNVFSILLSVFLSVILIFVSVPSVYLKKYDYNIFRLLKNELAALND